MMFDERDGQRWRRGWEGGRVSEYPIPRPLFPPIQEIQGIQYSWNAVNSVPGEE